MAFLGRDGGVFVRAGGRQIDGFSKADADALHAAGYLRWIRNEQRFIITAEGRKRAWESE
jgi:hypothetical protein